MAKKKIFISFDFDNDKFLKDALVGQSKYPDSPFEISDYSLKEAKPEADWLDHAKRAIGRSDVVIFVLGPKTKTAPGVLKELAVAEAKGKSKFQLIGYKDGSTDWSIVGAGRTYKWTWENLKNLLS